MGISTSKNDPENFMSSAIIGFGAIGQALARAFARKNLQVAVAARRPPEAIAPQATAIGPTVTAHALQDALRAEIVILAVPFGLQDELAQAADWQGKIVIDATNAYGVSLDELGGLPSSVVNAQALVGSRLVKAFNHLPARTLAQDPNVKGGRRVTFLSSDDDGAALQVAALVEQLGFAPVNLGKLAEGGLLVQARGSAWAQLIFQDLVKFD
jgi:8-hydroxy-5-deazaflavin:NADPH oxidoreductase